MKNFCVIYHWWANEGEPPPYQNLRTPIILSIANLRAVCPDVPVLVLDMSETDHDWGHFPEKLNFKVVKERFKLDKLADRVDGWRHLSRLIDINYYSRKHYCDEYRCESLVYLDSDVFLFRTLFPLNCEPWKFCWNGWNSGFFYYSPNQAGFMEFYDIFKHYTYASIYSQDVRQVMKKYVGYDAWYGVWDEMILTYMRHEHPDLFHLVPLEEHITARTLFAADPDKAKVFHCNGSEVHNSVTGHKHARGLICLIAEEFYRLITSVLDEQDLQLIFGSSVLEHYQNRFELLKSVQALPSIKNEEGLYELHRLIPQTAGQNHPS